MTALQKQIQYWRESGKRNFETAHFLFRGKRYDACLFFCHLSIEKLLKGLIVLQTKKPAPYIHNLEKLAELAKLEVSLKRLQYFRIITTFNIAGRYDDAKYKFYKKCTPSFTQKYFSIVKELFLWLEKEYQKE